MTSTTVPETQSLLRTRCGRTITVSRFAEGVMPPDLGRVVLDMAREPYDQDLVWASLTPDEARALAGLLIQQAAAVERSRTARTGAVEAHGLRGDAYAITARDHLLTVDQPLDGGGTDTGPTPVELLVAALAGCVAHYAGRYLDRHGIPRDGLRVTADRAMAHDRPTRIASIDIGLSVPGLPPERVEALLAVVSHCTVHTTLQHPPELTISMEQQR
ncbi:OsmC family protein [Kitasatospora sp. NPDC127111]|uniref:OsmC family protein n=1 Tax=Kitasatospora sp. NPDC127111 TaxID=3345363 RepID=UPI00363B416D